LVGRDADEAAQARELVLVRAAHALAIGHGVERLQPREADVEARREARLPRALCQLARAGRQGGGLLGQRQAPLEVQQARVGESDLLGEQPAGLLELREAALHAVVAIGLHGPEALERWRLPA